MYFFFLNNVRTFVCDCCMYQRHINSVDYQVLASKESIKTTKPGQM